MIVIGAKGHALEIADILKKNGDSNFSFYDDYTSNEEALVIEKEYTVIRTLEGARNELIKDNRFILGVGKPEIRHNLYIKFKDLGGRLVSIISKTAIVGDISVEMESGLNVMHNVFISNHVKIGKGVLLNFNSSVHHDCTIGQFSEISPGVQILGGVKIGSFCQIGAGAIILPTIQIGDNVIVGAGAVVTKNICHNSIVKGIPAK